MQLKVPDCKLSNDLETLLSDFSFADCTFAVDDEEFKAHKAIVAGKNGATARSILRD